MQTTSCVPVAFAGLNLFVANSNVGGNGTVGEYTISGATVNTSLVSGLSEPSGIAVSGTQLFVVNYGSGTIDEYTLGAVPGTITSSILSLISGLNNPSGIAVSGSDLFVTNSASGTIGEYTTSGATLNASLVSGLSGTPLDLAVSGSNLFVTRISAGTIDEYTLGATPGTISSSIPSLISGLNGPIGIAVTPDVPEPSALWLMALGSGALLVGRRKCA